MTKNDNLRAPAAGERALVLGGGGSLGNAWVLGVIAGLSEAGLNVTNADLIIGTSAGSTAAAQITAVAPTKLYADILSAEPKPQTNHAGLGAGRAPVGPAVNHMERTGAIIAASKDHAEMRRRMGAAALELDEASDSSWQAHRRGIVAARLPSQDWPEQKVQIVAVDARTGEPIVFDRDSGVELADAIAASTSSGPAFGIGDNRYIDGGYRRNENADLAAGCGRVLVLSPLGGRTRHPLEWGSQLAAQADELRANGSQVETILPDTNSLEVFGGNMMDFSRYKPAAQAGYDQGKSLADKLKEFWN
jgi:NTE family protein